MSQKFPLMFVLAIVAAANAADAEIVLPTGSQGSVPLVRVDQFAIYHKQRQELIVQATIDLAAGPPGVERLAFVIPVPAVPEIAALEDSPVLLDMRSYKRQPPDDLRKLPEIAGDCSPSIVVPQANVPVSETLNDWLTLNGLQRITAGKLKFYDDNGWSFVVQRVSGIEHRNAAALRPVRISFGAGHITFPLRLMTDAGPFFCRLFLVTKRSLDVTPLEEYGFTVNDDLSRTTLKQLPDSAELLVSRSGSSFSVFKELRHGHIHLFSAAGEFRQPLWRSEVQLAGPDVSLSSVVPNVLAVAAAVIAVILMNGPRRKVHNDR